MGNADLADTMSLKQELQHETKAVGLAMAYFGCWMAALLLLKQLDLPEYRIPFHRCFSCIALTTAGYGDVRPVSKIARMPAIREAITGLFCVGVFISRQVAIYSSGQPAAVADAADKS